MTSRPPDTEIAGPAAAEWSAARIGERLHDDLSQALSAVSYLAAILKNDLQTRGAGEAAQAVEICAILQETSSKLRVLMRELQARPRPHDEFREDDDAAPAQNRDVSGMKDPNDPERSAERPSPIEEPGRPDEQAEPPAPPAPEEPDTFTKVFEHGRGMGF